MSGLSFKQIRTYYNLCAPDEPLKPNDPRNIDLDQIQIDNHSPRGRNWVQRLAKQVELSDEPVFLLFSGLPGSGKSTELKRLMKRLEDKDMAHLLPIYVDAEEVLDLTSPLDVPDIIANLLHAADCQLLQLEGSDDEGMRSGYLARLWHWLESTEIELTEGKVGLPAGSNLAFEMKARPSFREQVRQIVAKHLKQFLKRAHAELHAIEARAMKLGYSGVVLIFDSLEKLRGMSTTWHEVLLSAERLFGGQAPYLRLPVHTIYTVPPALAFRLQLDVEFMPMIKLREKTGEPCEAGCKAARKLVRARIPDDDLHAFLGEQTEERVQDILAWSGGYPRELIRILRKMLAEVEPGSVITDAQLARVRQEIDDAYRQVVPASSFPWLARVAQERYLTIKDDAHREDADTMLTNNAVLHYHNNETWFDLHPSLYRIPGLQQAIRALSNAPSTDVS